MSFRVTVLATFVLAGCAALQPASQTAEEPVQEPQPTQIVTASVDPTEDAVVLLREEFTTLKRENQQLQEEFAAVQAALKRRDEEFLRLQAQWETNFALMERSVADSLTQQGERLEKSLKELKDRPAPASTQPAGVAAKPVESAPPEQEPEPKPVQQKEEASAEEPSAITTYSLIGTVPKAPEEINEDDLKEAADVDEAEPVSAPSEDDPLPGLPLAARASAASAQTEPASVASPAPASAAAAVVPVPEKQPGFHDPDLDPPENPQLLRRRPGVKKLYNQGMDALIKQNYDEAIRVFENFVIQFPDDLDADNSQHWVGHAHFKLSQLEDSEIAFRKVLRNYVHRPTSQGYKTPEAILMLGRIAARRKQPEQARYYWEEVQQRYPRSSAAREAKRDLARLGGQ